MSVCCARAETMTILMPDVVGSARSRAVVVSPSRTGSAPSSTITCGRIGGDGVEAGLAVLGEGDVEALELEVHRDEVPDHRVVFDDEHPSASA